MYEKVMVIAYLIFCISVTAGLLRFLFGRRNSGTGHDNKQTGRTEREPGAVHQDLEELESRTAGTIREQGQIINRAEADNNESRELIKRAREILHKTEN